MKLDIVARAVMGAEGGKIEIDVTTFPDLMKTQEGRDQITEYCIRDTQQTYELYKRMQGVLFA
jgi:hypothetical protein